MNFIQMLLVGCKYVLYVGLSFFAFLSLIGLVLGGLNTVLFLFFVGPVAMIYLNYMFMDTLIERFEYEEDEDEE